MTSMHTIASSPTAQRTDPLATAVAESCGPRSRARPSLPDRATAAYTQALAKLAQQQQPNGAFAGEVVWNPMLPCQYVILCHILGHRIAPERRQRIELALARQVRPDGGWAMHPDGPSQLFHTTLGYVALRLLGHPSSHPLATAALRWIHQHGPVARIPTWGRIWLAMLGLHPWDTVQPIVPELWLLPAAAPLHPRRLYCHMRLIYLGLSYVVGSRFVAPTDQVIEALRRELYPDGYRERDFEAYRNDIAPTDLYEPPSRGLRTAFAAMAKLERWLPKRLRAKALAKALEEIRFEFRSTDYVCLSPVNGMLFCLALHIADPRDRELSAALRGLEYWFWEDDQDGTRIAGARSDIWDTAFTIAALSEGPALAQAREITTNACRWLPSAQIQAEIVGGSDHFRSPAYGGWGFANEHHPWPVSDCTGEALEALLRAEQAGLSDATGHLDRGRVLAAIEFILLRQNDDGGFGSYEARRGSMALRRYNPAEIYGNCMLEYSYSECTGTCIRALAYAADALGDAMPPMLAAKAREAIRHGQTFLLGQQDACGGWMGFWGINVTYGTMFALSGLLASGLSRQHPAIVAGCRWLVENQRPDGGWAESYLGMLTERPCPAPANEPSNVTQTAWALLTLLEAAPAEQEAIDRGIRYLLDCQLEDGGWPQQSATGCFFNTAVLDYLLYRQIFPTWALARYLRHVATASPQPV